jgi:uncharacterized protein YeaO (DUF488 family)
VKKPPPLRIKRVYAPPEAGDGARVLVDRLWPRGLRKAGAALSCWMKEIAPTPELREWFGHDRRRFQEFARRYRAELARNGEAVARLRDLAQRGPVTLLYAARDEECNHAAVLAEYIQSGEKGATSGDET